MPEKSPTSFHIRIEGVTLDKEQEKKLAELLHATVKKTLDHKIPDSSVTVSLGRKLAP